jgi:hypothetical protein
VVALALYRGLIGLCEDRLDLAGIEVAQRGTSRALFWNMQNPGAQRDGGGFSCRRKSEERANRRQAAITRADRTAAFAFAMIEEGKNESLVEVLEAEAINPSAVVLGREAQEKTPSVTVGTNRMRRKVALLDRPVIEKSV